MNVKIRALGIYPTRRIVNYLLDQGVMFTLEVDEEDEGTFLVPVSLIEEYSHLRSEEPTNTVIVEVSK